MAMLFAEQVRRTPAYTFAEAAHCLGVPVSTLRAWCSGQDNRHQGELRRYHRVIRLDGAGSKGLSFLNLVEAHVLCGLRGVHHVPLPCIRSGIDYVARQLKVERPLAQARFATRGLELYVEHLSDLIALDRGGQLGMQDILEAYLKRVERDLHRVPIKLYPFTRQAVSADAARNIVIDPAVAFGRPVLVGTRVPTAVLADRFKAGDSMQELADDFRTTTEAIEEAIRCEVDRREAA
jgi:uncharacterized protein (DUF433 family)